MYRGVRTCAAQAGGRHSRLAGFWSCCHTAHLGLGLEPRLFPQSSRLNEPRPAFLSHRWQSL